VRRALPPRSRSWSFKVTAQEAARFNAGIFRLRRPRVDKKSITRSLARGAGVLRARGTVKAYHTPRVKFPGRPLKRGWYVYGVRIAAETNARRTVTSVGRPFRVG
jgi:hypothetical protein